MFLLGDPWYMGYHYHAAKYLEDQQHSLSPAQGLGAAKVTQTDTTFNIKVNVRQFNPDEIVVKTLEKERQLVVSGGHDARVEDYYTCPTGHGIDGVYTARSFSRQFKIPKACVVDDLRSEIDVNGLLSIAIPKNSGVITHSIQGAHQHDVIHPLSRGLHLPGHWRPWTGWPWSWSSDEEDPTITGFTKTEKNFVYRVKVPQFSPDELVVKTEGDFLIIEGDSSSKPDVDNGPASRKFKRQYLLPMNALNDDLICEINKKGVLTVRVPRIPLDTLAENVKVYKITRVH